MTTLPAIQPFRNEKQFQEWLRQAAFRFRWKYHHETDSRRSPAGFLDTELVRSNRIIKAELKMPGKYMTPKQKEWFEAYERIPGVEVYLWRPADRDRIIEILK